MATSTATQPPKKQRGSRAARSATSAPLRPSKVRRLAAGLWWVESSSHPGQGHKVRVHRRTHPGHDELLYTCTCPAASYGRATCRHRTIIAGIEAWRQEQLAQPAPHVPASPSVPPQTGQPVALTSYFE